MAKNYDVYNDFHSSRNPDRTITPELYNSNRERMAENSAKWLKTDDPEERERLHRENMALGHEIGMDYNDSTGTWSGGYKIEHPSYAGSASSSWNTGSSAWGDGGLASSNPYNQILEAQRKSEQRLKNSKKTQLKSLDAQIDDARRTAYIEKMQAQYNVPATLALTGQTGGLSETVAAAPQVTYQNALAGLDQARMRSANEIELANDQQSLSLAMDYADRLIAQLNSDRSYNYAVSRDQVSDSQWRESFHYSKEQNALSACMQTGNFSRMKQYGWTDEMIAAEEAAWKRRH